MKSKLNSSLAGVVVFGVFAVHSAISQSFIYTAGHADIGVAYEGGALEPHWHMHGDAVVNGASLGVDSEFAPGEALAFVPNPSSNRPPGVQWDFLGTSAGSPLWVLPASNIAGKPFLGIASEELTPSEWTSLTVSLVGVSGPSGGAFSLWQTDEFGSPVVKMASGDGFSGADTMTLNPGGHDHYFFGFTKAGVYQVTLKWDGEHTGDGSVSATDTFAFGVTVVPEPADVAWVAALGLGAFAWHRRRGSLATARGQ